MEIKEFTIDFKEWGRGLGPGNGILYDPNTHKRCCLGFLGNACGLKDSELEHRADPEAFGDEEIFPEFLYKKGHNSAKGLFLMMVNDDDKLPDHVRMKLIETEFKANGITVKWTNVPVHILQDYNNLENC